MDKEKKPLVVVAGPTAVGKSAAAVELARVIGGEVISADSMQVYRHMDIGSAKVTLEEMMGVPHHLIDVASPTEAFDVVRFAEEANRALAGIYERGHIPILCGGTGFYIQAVVRGIDFTETGADETLRASLNAFADQHGNEALWERLKEQDPDAAEAIHPNNRKRVVRALEYLAETGEMISAHNEKEKQKPSPYNLAYFVITDSRERLYERINARVDFMLDEGLIEEVTYLKAMGLTRDMRSMQGLGYKEVLDYLDGTTSYEEMVHILKRDTRHFAKRQLTWFRREADTIWLNRQDYGDSTFAIRDRMCEILEEKGILPKERAGERQ